VQEVNDGVHEATIQQAMVKQSTNSNKGEPVIKWQMG